MTDNATSKISLSTPDSVNTNEDVFPIYKSENELNQSYKEHDGDVERKCNSSIHKQCYQTCVQDDLNTQPGAFKNQTANDIHDHAYLCISTHAHQSHTGAK